MSEQAFIESRPDPSPWHPMDHFEPEETELPHDPDELKRLARFDPELLQLLLRVLIVPDGGKPGNLQAILCRTIALCHVMHVPGIGDRSLTELAGKIGVTKALLSHYCVKLRDFGGLDHYAGKSDTARASLSAARLWKTGSKAKRQKRTGGLFGIDTEKITEGAL